ncbi:MAG TPA: carbohydrate ABC transporter permease [Ruminiclostridium sp.]
MVGGKRFIKVLLNVVAWIVSLIMMIPLLLMFINSLKDKAQADAMSMELPKKLIFHFENYITVIEKGKLFTSFFNSMIYAGFAIIITVIFTLMASYVLARNKSKLNNFFYFFFILGLAIPVSYIPLMKIMQVLKLNNTMIGIILIYAAIQIPLGILLSYAFIASIPVEMDEAGIIDGCNPIRLFFSIIVPLLKPVTVTLGILCFIDAWNQFQAPLYFLNSATKWPMTLSVYNFFGQYSQSWNLVSADVVLTSLPVLIFYILGQKYIISGMTAGSVK